MKKIISIMVALAMLLVSSSALAASTKQLTANYAYDSETNSFVVSGTIDDDKSGDTVTVEILLDGVAFDSVITETKKVGTEMRFETDKISVDSSKNTGIITFNVSSAHASNTVFATNVDGGGTSFQYYGIDQLYPVMKQLVSAMKSGNYSSYIATVSSNAAMLYVDVTSVPQSEPAVRTMTAYNTGVSLSIPNKETYSELTASEITQVFDACIKFKQEFINMTMVGKFADASNSSEFISTYEAYSDKLKMVDLQNGAYFTDNYKNSEYFTILNLESREISDVNELKNRMLEASALYKVKSGNPVAVKQVFTDFSAELTSTYSLTEIENETVFERLSGNQFKNYEDLLEEYNRQAVIVISNRSGQQGGITSGVVTGGGYNNVVIGSVKDEPIAPPTSVVSFTDMELAPWAENAVMYLVNKGIVSGRTETLFAPNDDITRGEFVKLMVVAKGGSTVSGNSFSDVSGKWYSGYAEAARQMNITSGYPDGTFRGDEKISRQDMAVMIFRMSGFECESTDITMFNDKDAISDYAVNAVATLYIKNIISGMDDGSFRASSNATRAQAAQMLYNLLNK